MHLSFFFQCGNFDKVIYISKDPKVFDIDFRGPSNLTENAAFQAKKNIFIIINFYPVESWNAEKERVCPKALPFKQLFALRCLLAILKWNDPMHCYQELMDHAHHVQLNEKCMNILALYAKVRPKARDKARLENSKIARNKKRKEARIKNRIDPNGINTCQ